MDTFAVVDYPAVDIQLDRTWSAVDRKRRTNGWTSQAAGVYPGLDRFGRVVAQSWLDGVTGSTAAGYRPAIVDQLHTYDLASNRLSKRDGRSSHAASTCWATGPSGAPTSRETASSPMRPIVAPRAGGGGERVQCVAGLLLERFEQGRFLRRAQIWPSEKDRSAGIGPFEKDRWTSSRLVPGTRPLVPARARQ